MKNIDKKYDVVIIGGGVSGCACAYNCAKLKMKTLLVEKNNFLGGLMTGGLVIPIMKSSVKDYNCSYYKTLVKTAKKYNAQITYSDSNDGWFNPELMKIVIEDVLTKKDIASYLDILFEAEVSEAQKKDDVIKKVILKSRTLSIPIESTFFVDATGSAEFSKIVGCEFLNDNETIQQNSLRFIVGNVDVEKFARFIEKVDLDRNITNTNRNDLKNTNNELHFTTASTSNPNTKWALDEYLKQGVKDKILKPSDREYFQLFSVAGGISQVAFNCPRINNYKLDQFCASKELIEAKKAIYRLFCFVKKYFEGFSDAIITNIAPITGIREEYRVKCRYTYTLEDLTSSKRFNNPVLEANYGIDIHSKNHKTKNNQNGSKTASYQLPVESLMSYNYKNLYCIGKILGADFATHSALRVQKSCMSMGEAAAKDIKNRL